jgi:hypothetical protein
MDTNKETEPLISRIGERSPRRPGLKAWPSLRVRCSGGLAETISYFTTKHTKVTQRETEAEPTNHADHTNPDLESGNQKSRNWISEEKRLSTE